MNHRELIIDQFTKQAIPFSEMHGRSHEESLQLLLTATKVTREDSVLDVACGPGLVAFAFATVARHVTAIDVTPAMIERARILQADRGIGNVTWQVGDGSPLPFEEAAFSIVTCRYAFHHFSDPRAVAAEMIRVCTPGGRVALVDVFTTPEKTDAYNHMEKLRDPSHVRALGLEELVNLAGDGGLALQKTQFYWMELEMEALLRASFPMPEHESEVRELLVGDIGRDRLGMRVHRRGEEIHLAYPIALIVGEKVAQL